MPIEHSNRKIIKFHFFVKDLFISNAIEYFSRGEFSHVVIEMEGGRFLEAIGGRMFGTNGLQNSPELLTLHQGKLKPKKIVTVPIEVSMEGNMKAWQYYTNQPNRNYGYKNILPFIFRWIPRKRNIEICSKLAMEMFREATGCYVHPFQSPQAAYNIIRAYFEGQRNPITL